MRKAFMLALPLALLTACNAASTPGTSAVPMAQNVATQDTGTPEATTGSPARMLDVRGAAEGSADTDFTTDGRYIELATASANGRTADTPYKFYVKGMVYSPTPIGTNVGEKPLMDDALRNDDKPIWSRDLPLMRAMGVNAIHVYNVVPPPYDSATGPITDFLNAAWNNGNKPVYVIMSIYFTGDKLLDKGAVNALAGQYYDLDKKYAKYPAVMGVAISNEIGAENFVQNKTWWANFNIVAKRAKAGFQDGGDASKIVTTSEADSSLLVIKYGEQNNAAVDVWGVNLYRGRTFTAMFQQIKDYTKKPVMLTEYGASAAYHPPLKNTYSWDNSMFGLGACSPSSADGTMNRDAAELPSTGNPKMAGLVDLVSNNAAILWYGWKNENGLDSGGFYFEWTDEWWKGGDKNVHQGGLAFNGHFPGCTDDQGWFGLNSETKGLNNLDTLTPRPTLGALKDEFYKEK